MVLTVLPSTSVCASVSRTVCCTLIGDLKESKSDIGSQSSQLSMRVYSIQLTDCVKLYSLFIIIPGALFPNHSEVCLYCVQCVIINICAI